jgi:hypothetical protein
MMVGPNRARPSQRFDDSSWSTGVIRVEHYDRNLCGSLLFIDGVQRVLLDHLAPDAIPFGAGHLGGGGRNHLGTYLQVCFRVLTEVEQPRRVSCRCLLVAATASRSPSWKYTSGVVRGSPERRPVVVNRRTPGFTMGMREPIRPRLSR